MWKYFFFRYSYRLSTIYITIKCSIDINILCLFCEISRSFIYDQKGAIRLTESDHCLQSYSNRPELFIIHLCKFTYEQMLINYKLISLKLRQCIAGTHTFQILTLHANR